jgi:hypothetical protein
MKTRSLLILTVAFAAVTASAIGSQLTAKGIISSGELLLANLASEGGPSRWCKEGDSFSGFMVAAINATAGTILIVAPDGKQSELRLEQPLITGPDPARMPTKLLQPDALNWAWIRSDANPMRRAPHPLPEWAVRAWADLDEDLRNDFRNYYRVHGWELTLVEARGDRMRQDVSPLVNPSDPPVSKEALKQRAKSAGRLNKNENKP